MWTQVLDSGSKETVRELWLCAFLCDELHERCTMSLGLGERKWVLWLRFCAVVGVSTVWVWRCLCFEFSMKARVDWCLIGSWLGIKKKPAGPGFGLCLGSVKVGLRAGYPRDLKLCLGKKKFNGSHLKHVNAQRLWCKCILCPYHQRMLSTTWQTSLVVKEETSLWLLHLRTTSCRNWECGCGECFVENTAIKVLSIMNSKISQLNLVAIVTQAVELCVLETSCCVSRITSKCWTLRCGLADQTRFVCYEIEWSEVGIVVYWISSLEVTGIRQRESCFEKGFWTVIECVSVWWVAPIVRGRDVVYIVDLEKGNGFCGCVFVCVLV